jgi:hypothetical protein
MCQIQRTSEKTIPHLVGSRSVSALFVGTEPIERQQQPAAQLLFDRVMSVAHSGLCHLCNQGLRVAQEDMQKGSVTLNSRLRREPVSRYAQPPLCTMARFIVVSPPMNRATPRAPSLPTTA